MDQLIQHNHSLTEGKKVKIKVIPTEIYSRVVGYYRPVQDWNQGKVEEFFQRKMIDLDSLNR